MKSSDIITKLVTKTKKTSCKNIRRIQIIKNKSTFGISAPGRHVYIENKRTMSRGCNIMFPAENNDCESDSYSLYI